MGERPGRRWIGIDERCRLAVLKIKLATMIVNILSSFYSFMVILSDGFFLAAERVDRLTMDVIRWTDQVIVNLDKSE